jgi:hypothetical protein
MSEPRRTAEGNAGAFLAPDMGGGGGPIAVPMNKLGVGPGEPGPEDEWTFPTDLPETADQTNVEKPQRPADKG